jgi:uncharacterized protein YbaP (TraB family)
MGGRSAALILGLSLGVGGVNATDAPPTAPEVTQLEEISVVGERPGPRLWKVTKGNHVLWVLGTLTHVPRKMTWRSAEVEAALGQSQELVEPGVNVDAHIGPISAVKLYLQFRHTEKVPEHTTLKNWVPVPLYTRFEQAKSNFDNGDRTIEDMRPAAAALRLYEKAVDAAGLTQRDAIEQEVLKLAKKLHVPVQQPRLDVMTSDVSDLFKEVQGLPPTLDIDCLDATVTRIESDLRNMQQRAVAWSVGDVDRLRALPFPNQREVCTNAISSAPSVRAKIDQVRKLWSDEVDGALSRNQVSFAMVDIYTLLEPEGLLAQFRAKGYSVEGP